MIDNDITTSLAYVEMVNRYEERIGELIYENETLGKANEELRATADNWIGRAKVLQTEIESLKELLKGDAE